jgi:HlyD family secretion protein
MSGDPGFVARKGREIAYALQWGRRLHTSPGKGEVDSICFAREADAVEWGLGLRALFQRSSWCGVDPHPAPPDQVGGRRPPPISGRYYAAAALACALALAGCDSPHPPTYQGWVEAELIFVAPDEVGRVETLTVREGDSIDKGSLVFTVDADLQMADVAMAQASVKNAQLAYDRAMTLLKTSSGTQKTVEDAEAAMRTAQARLNSAQTRLTRRKVYSPVTGTIQQLYYRGGELVPAGRPVVAILPPGNLKIRFFVNEATLPKLKLADPVTVQCDGCDSDITAKISFIARTSEFTPPVIYSLDERSKLVFLIEARTADRPERLRVGQPVSVILGERQ